jgi:glyoxylase-like metal-dependent hydrolase (beta-lactamase superfamily II)
MHVANAHTSGDLAVYLPDEKVVITGDLIGTGDPFTERRTASPKDGSALCRR